jgi:hypothetical protein
MTIGTTGSATAVGIIGAIGIIVAAGIIGATGVVKGITEAEIEDAASFAMGTTTETNGVTVADIGCPPLYVLGDVLCADLLLAGELT